MFTGTIIIIMTVCILIIITMDIFFLIRFIVNVVVIAILLPFLILTSVVTFNTICKSVRNTRFSVRR